MNIIKKRLPEKELINEQYDMSFFNIVSNYRIRRFFDEIIDSFIDENDYELELLLEHEFSHIMTGYFCLNFKEFHIDKSLIESYKFLDELPNKIKIYNLFKCLSKTMQKENIENFAIFIKNYIDDFNSKKHLLSINTRFDDIIAKGNKHTNWILFKDVIQEIHYDIRKNNYEFLLCLCYLLNDAKLIETVPFIDRNELDNYLKDKTHEQIIENQNVRNIVDSMYNQIHDNLLEYQKSLNRQIYLTMNELYKNAKWLSKIR